MDTMPTVERGDTHNVDANCDSHFSGEQNNNNNNNNKNKNIKTKKKKKKKLLTRRPQWQPPLHLCRWSAPARPTT